MTQAEAAQLLGVCERTFRRYLSRYDEEGVDGLLDKRLSQESHRQGNPAAYVLKLSLEARRDWEDFFAAIESALKEGGELEAMRDWGGKLPGLAPAWRD